MTNRSGLGILPQTGAGYTARSIYMQRSALHVKARKEMTARRTSMTAANRALAVVPPLSVDWRLIQIRDQLRTVGLLRQIGNRRNVCFLMQLSKSCLTASHLWTPLRMQAVFWEIWHVVGCCHLSGLLVQLFCCGPVNTSIMAHQCRRGASTQSPNVSHLEKKRGGKATPLDAH